MLVLFLDCILLLLVFLCLLFEYSLLFPSSLKHFSLFLQTLHSLNIHIPRFIGNTSFVYYIWHRLMDLNHYQQFWRLLCYHYTKHCIKKIRLVSLQTLQNITKEIFYGFFSSFSITTNLTHYFPNFYGNFFSRYTDFAPLAPKYLIANSLNALVFILYIVLLLSELYPSSCAISPILFL